MNKPCLWVLNKDGFTSLEPESTKLYLQSNYYSSDSLESLDKMLDLYSVTMATFPIRHSAGKKIGKPDKTVEVLTEETRREKSLYYIVSPRVVLESVVKET